MTSKRELKYNYVITGDKMYTPPMFHDIASYPEVRLYADLNEDFRSPIGYIPFRLHFSKKVNRYFPALFSSYVNKRLYQPRFEDQTKPRCIIFISDRIDLYSNPSYLRTLRRHKEIKLVLYLTDLVVRHKNFDMEYARQNFDLVISYDQGDAHVYQLLYYPTPHCKINAPGADHVAPSDVYFCGKAKDPKRLFQIISVFEKCSAMGLNCDFHITETPVAQRVHSDIIHYDDSISYQENNRHIQQTKAILEVMQEGAVGFTPRLWDSIVNEKYLITNNLNIRSSAFYREEGMFFTPSLPEDLVARLSTRLHYPESFKNQLHPIHFLEFIEEKLNTL